MNVKDTPALQIRAYPILETHQDKLKKKIANHCGTVNNSLIFNYLFSCKNFQNSGMVQKLKVLKPFFFVIEFSLKFLKHAN